MEHAKVRERTARQGIALKEADVSRPGNRLGAAVHPQLAINVVDVPLGRAQGDDELIRDFLIGPAGGKQS